MLNSNYLFTPDCLPQLKPLWASALTQPNGVHVPQTSDVFARRWGQEGEKHSYLQWVQEAEDVSDNHGERHQDSTEPGQAQDRQQNQYGFHCRPKTQKSTQKSEQEDLIWKTHCFIYNHACIWSHTHSSLVLHWRRQISGVIPSTTGAAAYSHIVTISTLNRF